MLTKRDEDAALVLEDLIEEHRFPSPDADTPECHLADRVFDAAISLWLKTHGTAEEKLGVWGRQWTTSYGVKNEHRRSGEEHFGTVAEAIAAGQQRRSSPAHLIDVVGIPSGGITMSVVENHLACLFCGESVAAGAVGPATDTLFGALLRDVLAHTRPCGIRWLARLARRSFPEVHRAP